MTMVVSSDGELVALQCNSCEFEYESGSSCDKTYAKLYRPYQFEPYKSDVEEAEETSPLSVNDAIDTTLVYSTSRSTCSCTTTISSQSRVDSTSYDRLRIFFFLCQ